MRLARRRERGDHHPECSTRNPYGFLTGLVSSRGTHVLELCMLELRPTCENCNTALPPDSPDARICSYECTFCATCVDSVLGNVCPPACSVTTMQPGNCSLAVADSTVRWMRLRATRACWAETV